MPPLVTVLADAFAARDTAFPETAVFGTTDPGAIARKVEGFCRAELGSAVSDCAFLESGQSSVFGLILDDGRRVALRGHPPTYPLDVLNAVHRVQEHLAGAGFPCPTPILPPTRFARWFARVEELVDDGHHADAHRPGIRRAMAESLHRLIELTRDLRGIAGLRTTMLSRAPAGELWPAPHHPMFDFERTPAEWIDGFALRARASLSEPAGETVLGHGDWAVKDFRFHGERPRVIYDWESLVLDRETVLVGEAARGFTMTWHLSVPPAPLPQEARAFVDEYESARGRPFTRPERSTIAAAAVYAAAYTARCEHALEPNADSYPAGSFRWLLAEHGRELLHVLTS